MERLNTVLTVVSHNGNVKFPVMKTPLLLETSVDDLDLDTRSCHALHRAGMKTIRDVINNANTLHSIKNCGAKSVNRIMYKICTYYYSLLNEKEKAKYLYRLVELNTTKTKN